MTAERIAYFDCCDGISGDMVLGALIDAGLSLKVLHRELGRLAMPEGLRIVARTELRNGIRGTGVRILPRKKIHYHRRTHEQIARRIGTSALGARVKERALAIFSLIARAEAKVHAVPLGRVAFHEIGGLDSVGDIVGTAVGLEAFGVDAVHVSPLVLYRGSIETHHGTLPVPAPATAELLKGMPVRISGEFCYENVTPTGAGIAKALGSSFGQMPPMRVEAVGSGIGHTRVCGAMNMFRVFIGTAAEIGTADMVSLIETQIDDMNPIGYGDLIERLLADGALDAYLTPIVMKKSRPAVLLSVLVPPRERQRVIDRILGETTTMGLRITEQRRIKLAREIRAVKTRYGTVRVKIGTYGASRKILPEHDDCVRRARASSQPFLRVYDEARREAARRIPHEV